MKAHGLIGPVGFQGPPPENPIYCPLAYPSDGYPRALFPILTASLDRSDCAARQPHQCAPMLRARRLRPSQNTLSIDALAYFARCVLRAPSPRGEDAFAGALQRRRSAMRHSGIRLAGRFQALLVQRTNSKGRFRHPAGRRRLPQVDPSRRSKIRAKEREQPVRRLRAT